MGKVKEFMERDRAKDIYGPMVADYDLKQCIELKKKVLRHKNKVLFCYMIPFLLFAIVGAVLLVLTPWFIDLGLFTEENDTALMIVIFGYLFIFMGSGYVTSNNFLLDACNKRIEAIAGVSDGEETESDDRE